MGFRVGMEVRQKEFTCPQGMRTQTFTQRGFGHRASGAHIPGYQDPVGVRHPHNTHARDADAQQRRGGRYAFALIRLKLIVVEVVVVVVVAHVARLGRKIQLNTHIYRVTQSRNRKKKEKRTRDKSTILQWYS